MESEKKHALVELLLEFVRGLEHDADFTSTVISFAAKEAYACSTTPARIRMIAAHTISAYVHSAMLMLDLDAYASLTDAESDELCKAIQHVRSTAHKMLASIVTPELVTRIWTESQQQAHEACQQRASDADVAGGVYRTLLTLIKSSKEMN